MVFTASDSVLFPRRVEDAPKTAYNELDELGIELWSKLNAFSRQEARAWTIRLIPLVMVLFVLLLYTSLISGGLLVPSLEGSLRLSPRNLIQENINLTVLVGSPVFFFLSVPIFFSGDLSKSADACKQYNVKPFSSVREEFDVIYVNYTTAVGSVLRLGELGSPGTLTVLGEHSNVNIQPSA